MSRSFTAESKVSGNQANIPAAIRRTLDIDDGDFLRWVQEENGTIRVEVVERREGTFEGFDGYDVDEETSVVENHDEWGL